MQQSFWDKEPFPDSTPEPEIERGELTWEDIEQRLAAGTLLRRQREDMPEFDKDLALQERHYIIDPDGTIYHLFAFDGEHVYLEEPTPEERAEVEKEREQQGTVDPIQRFIEIGKELMDLHLHYDDAPEYPLEWRWSPNVEKSWYVTRMHFNRDRTELVVNESLTLAGIPPRCFEYVLGNRSAIEWVIDQYQITTDKRSGIISNPNDPENPEYIARHVCRVVHVSMETLRLQDELSTLVTPEDWLEEGISLEEMLTGTSPKDTWTM